MWEKFQQKDQAEKKSVAENYIYNMGYQILVLTLPLFTTPYVSRVLGPDGVGMYGLTNSISQYFVLFGCVGLNLYGQREVAYHQTDKKKKSIIFFELLLIRLITMSVSIAIFWFSVCNDTKYAVLYRVEFFELVAALLDITWFFQGMEEFKKIVIRNSTVKLSGVVFIFLLVRNENDTATYTAILVFTVLVGNLLMWLYLPQYIQPVKKKSLKISKHIKPALLLFVPQIATSVYNVLDKSMIGLITGSDAEVAYYEQAQKIIKIALAMPAAVGTVMLPRMASLYGEGNGQEIKKSIRLSMRFVCMLTFPLCFGIIGIAKDFVPWFYGAGFHKVYDNLLMIAPIIVLVGISNVLGVQYLLPINRQKDYTKSVIIGTAVNFTINALLIPSLFSIGAAIGSIIAEGAVTITQLFLLRNEFSIKQFLSDTYKYIFGSFIMIVPIFLYSFYIGKSSAIHTVIEICMGVVTYASYLLIVRDDLICHEAKKAISQIRRKSGLS